MQHHIYRVSVTALNDTTCRIEEGDFFVKAPQASCAVARAEHQLNADGYTRFTTNGVVAETVVGPFLEQLQPFAIYATGMFPTFRQRGS